LTEEAQSLDRVNSAQKINKVDQTHLVMAMAMAMALRGPERPPLVFGYRNHYEGYVWFGQVWKG